MTAPPAEANSPSSTPNAISVAFLRQDEHLLSDVVQLLKQNGFEVEAGEAEDLDEDSSFSIAEFSANSPTNGEARRLIIVADASWSNDPFAADWHDEQILKGQNAGPVSPSRSRPIILRFAGGEIPDFLFPAIVPADERIKACNIVDAQVSPEFWRKRLMEKLNLAPVSDEILVAEAMLLQTEWSVGLLFDLAKTEKSGEDGKLTSVEALGEIDRSLRIERKQALCAISRKDAAALRKLLVSDARKTLTEDRFCGGYTLLHLACVFPGADDIVDALLEFGASPFKASESGETPLFLAIWANESVAERLLDLGADSSQISLDGACPLSVAAWKGYAPLARKMLDQGAQPFLTDKECGHALLWAAQAGHTEIVKAILDKYPAGVDTATGDQGLGSNDPSYAPDDEKIPAFFRFRRRRVARSPFLKRTSLMAAALAGRIEIVEILHAAGADPNFRSLDDVRALHQVVTLPPGEAEPMVRLLVKLGAEVDAQDRCGDTPLVWTIRSDHPGNAKLLLEIKADPNIRNEEQFTAIHHAASFGKIEAIAALGGRADFNLLDGKGFRAIHLAMYFVDVKIDAIEQLLKCGADANGKTRRGQTPLSYLSLCPRTAEEKARISQVLIENGADSWLPDDNGRIALFQQALDGSEGFCNSVLDAIARRKPTGKDAGMTLICAAALGRFDLVKALVESEDCADFEAPDGFRPLAAAALRGREQIVDWLLARKVKINPRAGAPTALSRASENGHFAIVSRLLATGADPNTPDANGRTPLYFAVVNGHDQIVKSLIEARAYPDARTTDGATPLMLGSRGGNSAIARMLIDAGANVNAVDAKGDTPLHFAARNNSAAWVETLLQAGADSHVANESGKRAVDLTRASSAYKSFGVGSPESTAALTPESEKAIFLDWTAASLGQIEAARKFLEARSAYDFDNAKSANLPFYRDISIVAIALSDYLPPNEIFLLVPRNGIDVVRLDWTNEPIYDFNAKHFVKFLDDAMLMTYVKFFFFFVRGQLGRFNFVEKVEEVEWNERATADDRARVGELLQKLHILERPGDDRIVFGATVVFKNALFFTKVLTALKATRIPSDEEGFEYFSLGQHKLFDEDLLIEELPVVIGPPPELYSATNINSSDSPETARLRADSNQEKKGP